MKISFVILHYMAVDDTIECIESIRTNIDYNYNKINIVVVDNNSPDDSYRILNSRYNDDNQIALIHMNENLGFAKGNNVGFIYAKENLNPDFIVMINNDTIIKQRKFCELICKEYKQLPFDIAGPNITSLKDSLNQNPIPYIKPTISSVNNRIIKNKLLKIMARFNLDLYIKRLHQIIKPKKKEPPIRDFKLHGSALIFSKEYINRYNGLYDKTFMYCEEDILKWISIRDSLKMRYLSNVEIIHKEDSSTDKLFSSNRKKRIFYYKWNIDSLKELKELMQQKEV